MSHDSFDDVIMFQDDHWSQILLWINQINKSNSHMQGKFFLIPVSIGNVLIEKSIKVFSKPSGLKYD